MKKVEKVIVKKRKMEFKTYNTKLKNKSFILKIPGKFKERK